MRQRAVPADLEPLLARLEHDVAVTIRSNAGPSVTAPEALHPIAALCLGPSGAIGLLLSTSMAVALLGTGFLAWRLRAVSHRTEPPR